jgi:hypothetical protein
MKRTWLVLAAALVLLAVFAVPAGAATPDEIAGNVQDMALKIGGTVFIIAMVAVALSLMPGRQWPALVAAVGFFLLVGWLVFDPDSVIASIKETWHKWTS